MGGRCGGGAGSCLCAVEVDASHAVVALLEVRREREVSRER